MTSFVSTYQRDFSGESLRPATAAPVSAPVPKHGTDAGAGTSALGHRYFKKSPGVTIDGREVGTRTTRISSARPSGGVMFGGAPSKPLYSEPPSLPRAMGLPKPPTPALAPMPAPAPVSVPASASLLETRPLQAARVANYTRFSPSDWSSSNLSHFNMADNARNVSERIRSEAMRLIRERDDRTVLTQRDSDRRIGERLHDVSFWRTELQNELEKNVGETHHLMESRKSLERALAETEGPLRITSECIYHREGRKGIDLVNDAAENALIREVDVIKAAQERMRKMLEQVNHQLGLSRNCRHQLERDLANKDQALAIDQAAHQLQNTSRNINVHGGVERLDPNVSIPETWAETSNRNIQESQAARSGSARLRADVDHLITSSANELWSSWSSSNTALQQRVSESQDAHNKLQSHLAKTLQEIYDMDKHIQMLQRALKDKEAPLKVAQSRLEARSHRPDVELCRDPVHHRLVEEVQQIQESIELLQRKLSEAEQGHQELLVNKARLEHDLKVKANSIFIDREKCLSTRKSFPVVSLAAKL